MINTLGARWIRFVLIAVVAGCQVRCSKHCVTAHRETVWPDPAEIVRVELVPGVSVLAPFASLEQGEISKPWGRVLCKNLEPMPSENQAIMDCTWYGDRASRTLAFALMPGMLREKLGSKQKLDALAKKFSLSGGEGVELRQLEGPWVGWSWTARAQGNLIQNRFVVVGCDVAFLQAVSELPDLFEGAELFFDSLAVDWERRSGQGVVDCSEQ